MRAHAILVGGRRWRVLATLVSASMLLGSGRARADASPAAAGIDGNADAITKARTLAKWGDRAGALRLLAARVEAEPSDADARTLHASMMTEDGKWEDARVELEQALRWAPDHRTALHALVRLELASGHPDRALLLSSDGLRRHPADSELRLDRARAYLLLLQLDEAAAELDGLLSLEPSHGGALELRQRVHDASDRWNALMKTDIVSKNATMEERALAFVLAVPRGLELLSLLNAKPVSRSDARPETDLLANARALSSRGDRNGALQLLAWHLEAKPSDTDARTLYGTILSWEGRYDEAREQLAEVLRASPGHYDATRVALRIELWSDHPERAEDMATQALDRERDSIDFLLDRARARFARDDLDGALDDLGRLLRIEPNHPDALRLRTRVMAAKRVWGVGGSYTLDAFNDGRAPWHETTLRLKRRTPLGSVIFRGYEAWRSYGDDHVYTSDRQFELEAYPRIREGTYANVGGAVAPNAELYPKYRLQIDVYQSLPLAFEVSVGYRHMQFSSGVDMGVVTVGKYLGDWFFTLRSFITPGVAGTSVSASGSVRRYFFDGAAYVGARYGHGISKEELRSVNDIALLASNTGAAEAYVVVLDRFEIGAGVAISQEVRVNRDDLWQYDVNTSLGFRF